MTSIVVLIVISLSALAQICRSVFYYRRDVLPARSPEKQPRNNVHIIHIIQKHNIPRLLLRGYVPEERPCNSKIPIYKSELKHSRIRLSKPQLVIPKGSYTKGTLKTLKVAKKRKYLYRDFSRRSRYVL